VQLLVKHLINLAVQLTLPLNKYAFDS